MVFGGSVLVWARTLGRRTRAVLDAGQRTGLAPVDEHHLRGEPRGLPVEAREGWGGWHVEVRLNHPVAGVRDLQKDPRVALYLERAADLAAREELGGSVVVLRGVHPGNLEPAVVAAVELALALQDAFDLPLAAWCRSEELALQRSPAEGLRRVEGTLDGWPVDLRLGGDRTRARCEVHVAVDLPPGLRLRRREDAPEAPGVGDPFLDRLLAVDGADTPEARALLQDGARMAPLLEILREHPGSRVEGPGLCLCVHGPLLQPGAVVDRALEAARALSARS